MFLGWEGVVRVVVGGGSQAGGGRHFRGQSELVLQLAAPVPLAIVPSWPGAQPPKWQLRNQAEGGWGGDLWGKGTWKGRRWGEIQSVSFCVRQL